MAPTTKDELLNEAAREYKALHEALQGLNETQMTEVWLGTWSVRDIVAHIAGWHQEMSPALERLARGERPMREGVSYDDVDGWNERFTAARRGTAVADVLLELDRTHEAFMKAAAAVPMGRFEAGKTAWKIVDGNSAHHYHEHAEQIRAWRSARRFYVGGPDMAPHTPPMFGAPGTAVALLWNAFRWEVRHRASPRDARLNVRSAPA